MSNRKQDRLEQAQRDLNNASYEARGGFHEWACFAAHQAAEKALKAVFYHLGGEAWGHGVLELLTALEERTEVPDELKRCGRELDRFYIPTRYRTGGLPENLPIISRTRIPRMPSVVQKKSYGSVKVFWLDRKVVIDRLRRCVETLMDLHPEIESVGLFGSLAEGTSKPGSDADLLIVLESEPTEPFHQRSEPYELHFSELGIGVDLFCYSRKEIRENKFAADAAASAIWLSSRP